jgi:hypothetical protein
VATHDYVIANGTGAAVRSDLNGALAAIVSQNSSATEPSPTYAYQRWADTTAGVMKMRNGANSAWISLYELDGTFLASDISLAAGSAAAPSLFFTGDTNTGLFSPGADTVALATAGSNRLHITSGGLVGIGFSGPQSHMQVLDQIRVSNSAQSQGSIVLGDGSSAAFNVGIARWNGATNAAGAGGIGYFSQGPGNVGGHYFYTGDAAAGSQTASLIVNPSGNVGIGTTAPNRKLEVSEASADNFIRVNTTSAYKSGIEFASGGTVYGQLYFNNVSPYDLSLLQQYTTGSLILGTNNTERARIDSSGRLLVGTSTARSNFYNTSFAAGLQVESITSTNRGLALVNNSAADNPSSLILARSNADTIGSNAVVASGTWLGNITFQGADGSEFVEAARIDAYVDGTPGANDMPGRLVFSTTADGASSPTERMKINNTGSFTVIGAVSAAGGTHTIRDSGSSPDTLRLYNNTDSNNTGNRFLICDAGASILRAEIRSNGGLANFSANNANLSDRNAKKDISLAADTWNCVKEWEIVNYRYNDQPDDADLNLGVIAQQVAESCPEVITVFQEAKEATETEPAKEERLGVKEQQMYWMAIKALQEAMERIEALEADVAALKGA